MIAILTKRNCDYCDYYSSQNGAALLTGSLEVEPDISEGPHHVLELQQEGEQPVVLVHAAVRDDDVQRPVHLSEGVGVGVRVRVSVRVR